MKPCAAITAAEEHNGEGGVRNGIPLAPSWSESESVGRSCCHRTRDRLPTVSSLHFQQSLLPSRSLARSRWFEGTRGREKESWLARLLCSHYLIRSSGRVFCLVTCGSGGGASGRERARAAEGAGHGSGVVWPRGGREGGNGILLAAVGSVRGWSSLVRFCRRPPLPLVCRSVRPRVRAPASLRTHASTPLFLNFFTYCLLFVGVVYSSRSWTLGHDNTAAFDFIFRIRIWFDFWLECVPHLKLEIDIRFLSSESRITLISSESGGR